MNGINIIGFKTIGKPNMTGSLILNSPGAKLKFVMTLYGLLRRPTIKIAINRPNVAPVPPKFTNESKKGLQYKELLYLLLKL